MRTLLRASFFISMGAAAAAGCVLDAAEEGRATLGTDTSTVPGGGGRGGSCSTDADCSSGDTFCRQSLCEDRVCVVHFTPAGTPAPAQFYGDCQNIQCDGAGNPVSAPDDTDVYDTGNPCVHFICNGGQATAVVAPPGSPCIHGNTSGVCDMEARCGECSTDLDCHNGKLCNEGRCVPSTCTDGIKNCQETDVDCGGTDCNPCVEGCSCNNDSDCESEGCDGASCSAPTCHDGIHNGHETYVDCGGPDCPPCAEGYPCALPTDCDSDVCIAGTCAVASCYDAVQNGSEHGIDCDGPCPACLR